MTGRRILGDVDVISLVAGDYGRTARGNWVGVAPKDSEHWLFCNLERHTVTEHDDGSITVSPSILVSSGHDSWHGFLERGVWRECQ